MVFKPAIIGRLERLSFTEGKRMSPYMIDSSAYSESVRIKLPTGFDVDEVPESSPTRTRIWEVQRQPMRLAVGIWCSRAALQLSRTLVPGGGVRIRAKFFWPNSSGRAVACCVGQEMKLFN